MAQILCLNGPNLNLLGTREPDNYGRDSLADIGARLSQQAQAAGHSLRLVQSNAEHVLIDAVQQAGADGAAFALVNPAGLTHTSVALRDALLAVQLPFIEVHLSKVHAREAFRQHSYFSDIAEGTITGLGAIGYELALTAALRRLDTRPG
ncbi:MAG: type II 3-dehydroquinate dehydratase [Gammaproteobacteria bacterium]|jgi:3-dehydroquinate dehydratase-2|nr:type II 3-dehydroquinate dehydratase [Gammaproteobacteria bacterium]